MPKDFKWESFEQAPSSQEFNWDAHEAVAAPSPTTPDIGAMEAVARGGLSGALTSAVNIPLAGVDTATEVYKHGAYQPLTEIFKAQLEKEKAREKLAAQQQPTAYYGGMLGGGFVSPVGRVLKGAGLVGEAVKDAPLLQRLFQAGKTGAAFGGTYAAGDALTDVDTSKSVSENAQQATGKIGTGILGGAALGTAFHGLGEGIGAGISSAAEKEIPLISNAARRFQLGKEGVNLYNDAQMAARTAEKFKALGQEGISAEIDAVTDGMNKVLAAAKEKGQTVNYEEVLQQAQKLKERAQGMEPGEIQDELLDLAGRVKDRVNEFKNKVEINTLTKVGEREIPAEPGVEAQPSSLESLQTQADKLNQEAQLNSKATNQLAPRYEVKTQIQDGTEYQRIYEITPATAESGESIKPIGKSWTPAAEGQEYRPGTPSTTQAIYEPRSEKVLHPELEPQNARDARSAFGKNRSFDTQEARESSQQMYDAMSDSLYKGIPEYQPYSDKYNLFLSAMQDLGVDVKSPGDFFVQSADQLATGQGGKGSIFNPEIATQLKKSFQRAINDPMAKETLELGFQKLEKAGFQGIDALKANAEQALRDETLSVGLINPKSLIAPIGGPFYKGIKAASAAPNALGLGLNKLEGVMGEGLASGATKALAKTPVTDFLGNEIEEGSENFYKYLIAADDNTLSQVGQALQGTPYQYQGESLVRAIESGDKQKKNAMAFSIASNPSIESVLRGKAPGM